MIWIVAGVVVWLTIVVEFVGLFIIARESDEAMEQAPRPVRQPGVWD